MHSDDRSEFYVDTEELGRPCSGRHRAIEDTCTVRTDRTDSARRFGDGAAVVAVSPAEERGWVRAVTDEIIGVPRIGKSVALQCRS
jgi:hypothetical protein